MVDLVAQYSKQTDQVELVQKILDLRGRRWPRRPDIVIPVSRRLDLRLSDADRAELVQQYLDGATSRELGERFGLAKGTVVQLLRQQDVAIRMPRMSPEDVAIAVELYRQGVQQVDIAKQFGRHKGMIWHVLRRAGAL